ncbi:hypothetical protein SLA2020_034900 [Shorea laevis]
MILLSINIRGLGGVGKKRDIREKVAKHKVEILFIQETKLETIDNRLCKMIWDSENFEWVAQSAKGTSGGMLIIWNSSMFKYLNTFQGDGFLGVFGLSGSENIPCYLVNIYSSQDLACKRRLWDNLSDMVNSKKGNWCIADDFNVIQKLQERKGGISVRREIRDFNEFVERCGLVDLPMIGRKFT